MDEQLLFGRFHAALESEPRAGAYERLRAVLVATRPPERRRSWLRFLFPVEVPRRLRAVVAAVVILAIALAAIGGFVAINQYIHHEVPVRIHPRVPAVGTCSYGFHMVDSTTGWQGSTMRSTDGGKTWKQASTPAIPDQTKGGFGDCTLGGLHAWMTVAVSTPQAMANKNAPPQADHLLVLITVDGGQTWTEGGTVPASGINAGATLEFITDQIGWLLVVSDTTRILYGTTDGGYHWSRVSAPGTLEKFGGLCLETGITFATAERGWITWNCSEMRGSGPAGADSSSVVAATVDGGRTWSAPALPSFGGAGGTCAAAPPVFTGAKGVLAITCPGNGPGSWRAVYRTDDVGQTWLLGAEPPAFWNLSEIDFVDSNVGFAFSNPDGDLYRTLDSGQSWMLVKKNVFSRQQVDHFQFLNATTGLAYTTTSQGLPWKTTDGGQTWTLAGVRTLPGNVGCAAAWALSAETAPAPVLMKDRTTGWAGGALRTVDGGSHWSPSGPPAPALASSGRVEFYLDDRHAWVAAAAGSATACADHVVVYATEDAGVTWRTASTLPVTSASPADAVWGGLYSSSPRSSYEQKGPYLYFVDPTHGWMLVTVQGPGFVGTFSKSLYRTTDGGATWVRLNGPMYNCMSDQLAVVFSTPTTGWMPTYTCGPSGALALYVTHDAGDNWTLQEVGPECGCSGAVPVFVDAQHGVLISGPDMVVTSDRGQSWSSRTMPSDVAMYGPQAYSFPDSSHGWILFGEAGSGTSTLFPLYRTTDGGRSWSLLSRSAIPQAAAFAQTSMYFVDANLGFIAAGASLYRTTDGGRTWSELVTVIG